MDKYEEIKKLKEKEDEAYENYRRIRNKRKSLEPQKEKSGRVYGDPLVEMD